MVPPAQSFWNPWSAETIPTVVRCGMGICATGTGWRHGEWMEKWRKGSQSKDLSAEWIEDKINKINSTKIILDVKCVLVRLTSSASSLDGQQPAPTMPTNQPASQPWSAPPPRNSTQSHILSSSVEWRRRPPSPPPHCHQPLSLVSLMSDPRGELGPRDGEQSREEQNKSLGMCASPPVRPYMVGSRSTAWLETTRPAASRKPFRVGHFSASCA